MGRVNNGMEEGWSRFSNYVLCVLENVVMMREGV